MERRKLLRNVGLGALVLSLPGLKRDTLPQEVASVQAESKPNLAEGVYDITDRVLSALSSETREYLISLPVSSQCVFFTEAMPLKDAKFYRPNPYIVRGELDGRSTIGERLDKLTAQIAQKIEEDNIKTPAQAWNADKKIYASTTWNGNLQALISLHTIEMVDKV